MFQTLEKSGKKLCEGCCEGLTGIAKSPEYKEKGIIVQEQGIETYFSNKCEGLIDKNLKRCQSCKLDNSCFSKAKKNLK